MTWWAWPLAVLGSLTARTALGAAVVTRIWHPLVNRHKDPR